jgi:hypothetical protein
VAYVVYREHIIISTARYDDMSGLWKLKACIIWQGNGTERVKFLDTSPEIFSRFEDAEESGVEHSKDWVDDKAGKVVSYMELRNHPLMVRYGIPNWPPVWTPANPRDHKPSLRGEIGVLKYVLGQSSENTCFLMIVHDDEHYIGALLFDDRLFCQQICNLLQGCTGLTITEIGDSDLSHLL